MSLLSTSTNLRATIQKNEAAHLSAITQSAPGGNLARWGHKPRFSGEGFNYEEPGCVHSGNFAARPRPGTGKFCKPHRSPHRIAVYRPDSHPQCHAELAGCRSSRPVRRHSELFTNSSGPCPGPAGTLRGPFDTPPTTVDSGVDLAGMLDGKYGYYTESAFGYHYLGVDHLLFKVGVMPRYPMQYHSATQLDPPGVNYTAPPYAPDPSPPPLTLNLMAAPMRWPAV